MYYKLVKSILYNFEVQKHKLCPICQIVPKIIKYNEKYFTIKKKTIITWKPYTNAP